MIDPFEAIRSAYYQRLNGQLTLNGNPVGVYAGFAPGPKPRPFVLISTQTGSQRSRAMACQGWETSLLVDIVTEYPEGMVRISDADRIAGQVVELMEILNTRPANEIGPFEVIGHRLDSTNNMQEINGDSLINRRLLRFRDELNQVPNYLNASGDRFYLEGGNFILLETA